MDFKILKTENTCYKDGDFDIRIELLFKNGVKALLFEHNYAIERGDV